MIANAKVFSWQRCILCGLDFQPVTWIPARVRGYCCVKCTPEYRAELERKRGVKAERYERYMRVWD